jgi:hypothetical protein
MLNKYPHGYPATINHISFFPCIGTSTCIGLLTRLFKIMNTCSHGYLTSIKDISKLNKKNMSIKIMI